MINFQGCKFPRNDFNSNLKLVRMFFAGDWWLSHQAMMVRISSVQDVGKNEKKKTHRKTSESTT